MENLEATKDEATNDEFAGPLKFNQSNIHIPESYKYAFPELAAAAGLADAVAFGSSKARRNARILAFIAFGIPIIASLALLVQAII